MLSKIEQAVDEASRWVEIDGVEGVAQGERAGRDCILVLVSRSEIARRIPETLHGFPVVIEITGPIDAQNEPR